MAYLCLWLYEDYLDKGYVVEVEVVVVVVAGLTIAVVGGECLWCIPTISYQMTLSLFPYHFPIHAPTAMNPIQSVCP